MQPRVLVTRDRLACVVDPVSLEGIPMPCQPTNTPKLSPSPLDLCTIRIIPQQKSNASETYHADWTTSCIDYGVGRSPE